MPSPFPGMNPYLEQADVWHDFHEAVIPVIRDQIAGQLGPSYIVKIDEQVYIHEPSAEQRLLMGRGDVIVSGQRPDFDTTSTFGIATTESPVHILLPSVDTERISFLEIRDKRNRQVVTVLEMLSPTNKYSGPDRVQYLAKRGALLASRIHVVEFDLLRGGPRMPFKTPLPQCDYCIMVSRAENRPEADIWPISLRDKIPQIPVPVRESDPCAIIDLRTALDRVYDSAGYANYIYEGTPEPELKADDARWAKSQWDSRTS